jgi:hypothetical protein
MIIFSMLLIVHFISRHYAGIKQQKKLINRDYSDEFKASIKRAFIKNTHFFHSIFRPQVIGWGYFSRNTLKKVKIKADTFIQRLNDKYAMPSGIKENSSAGGLDKSVKEEQQQEAEVVS